jgi:hypothetical protein
VGIDKGIKPPFPLKKAYLEQQKREGMEFQHSHDGLLPSNTFWDYLRWRRDLNPKRFDYYHPGIACMMRIDHAKRTNDDTATKTTCHEIPRPPIATPEPSTSGMLAFGLIVSIVFATKEGKKRWKKQKA